MTPTPMQYLISTGQKETNDDDGCSGWHVWRVGEDVAVPAEEDEDVGSARVWWRDWRFLLQIASCITNIKIRAFGRMFLRRGRQSYLLRLLRLEISVAYNFSIFPPSRSVFFGCLRSDEWRNISVQYVYAHFCSRATRVNEVWSLFESFLGEFWSLWRGHHQLAQTKLWANCEWEFYFSLNDLWICLTNVLFALTYDLRKLEAATNGFGPAVDAWVIWASLDAFTTFSLLFAQPGRDRGRGHRLGHQRALQRPHLWPRHRPQGREVRRARAHRRPHSPGVGRGPSARVCYEGIVVSALSDSSGTRTRPDNPHQQRCQGPDRGQFELGQDLLALRDFDERRLKANAHFDFLSLHFWWKLPYFRLGLRLSKMHFCSKSTILVYRVDQKLSLYFSFFPTKKLCLPYCQLHSLFAL